jgi:hypothetical protein
MKALLVQRNIGILNLFKMQIVDLPDVTVLDVASRLTIEPQYLTEHFDNAADAEGDLDAQINNFGDSIDVAFLHCKDVKVWSIYRGGRWHFVDWFTTMLQVKS